jgi:hypothetical protein
MPKPSTSEAIASTNQPNELRASAFELMGDPSAALAMLGVKPESNSTPATAPKATASTVNPDQLGVDLILAKSGLGRNRLDPNRFDPVFSRKFADIIAKEEGGVPEEHLQEYLLGSQGDQSNQKPDTEVPTGSNDILPINNAKNGKEKSRFTRMHKLLAVAAGALALFGSTASIVALEGDSGGTTNAHRAEVTQTTNNQTYSNIPQAQRSSISNTKGVNQNLTPAINHTAKSQKPLEARSLSQQSPYTTMHLSPGSDIWKWSGNEVAQHTSNEHLDLDQRAILRLTLDLTKRVLAENNISGVQAEHIEPSRGLQVPTNAAISKILEVAQGGSYS